MEDKLGKDERKKGIDERRGKGISVSVSRRRSFSPVW